MRSPERPLRFLGILNLTPDSFSDGGLWMNPEAAVAQATRLVEAGAWGLDLGAESTRPGATPLDPGEEWRRLEPVLRRLRKELPGTILSLDTRHADVAERGLNLGIDLLNDVTGFTEPPMVKLAQRTSVPLIAMRSRRTPNGFVMPPYEGPGETSAERALAEMRLVRDRLLEAGVDPERIILDPGFGFGTTWTEDRAIWEALPGLGEALAWPHERVCIALSRKRFTAWMAGQPTLAPAERDNQTFQLHMKASKWGFTLFRTHTLGVPA